MLGIIGLGLLGSAISDRLEAAGHTVTGFDIVHEKSRASSPAAVAAMCPRILFSLPDSKIAAQVVREMGSALAPGKILIDTTTGDPDEMAAMGAQLAARGVSYLDATVGGSSEQVRAGDVIVLCGGERNTFDACQEVFSAFSRQTFYLGPCGSGARMKLVLNLVLGLNRAVLAEGLGYANACGIEMEQALAVLGAGPAHSRVMDIKGNKMLQRDFTPQARLSQHLKDVRLILETGARHGARVPLSRIHAELLEEVERAGFGAADNSAILKAFLKDS